MKTSILFLCVANSARSQMAEGLARQFYARDVRVESTGSAPSQLNPFAVRVMREIGIDISGHRSKSTDQLSPEFLASLGFVITLCAEEVCPTLASEATRLHWPFPDPAGLGGSEEERLSGFRKVRDQIRKRLEAFGHEIGLIAYAALAGAPTCLHRSAHTRQESAQALHSGESNLAHSTAHFSHASAQMEQRRVAKSDSLPRI